MNRQADVALSTTFLGLQLDSPIVVGAAPPLSSDLARLEQLQAEGAGAVVLHSLFLEQAERDWREWWNHQIDGRESHHEATEYCPSTEPQFLGLDGYVREIEAARSSVSIPVIASLNGDCCSRHRQSWVEVATAVEQAGADALELNLYSVPSAVDRKSECVEQEQLAVVNAVCSALEIPVAVKISPWYTGLAAMGQDLQKVGARGLVLFNRFYELDIDIETLETNSRFRLSTAAEQQLPLRWIGLLYGRIDLELVASGGIASGLDVIRMLMAGAQVTQVVSALIRQGPGQIVRMHDELLQWLESHGIEGICDLQGTLSHQRCADPENYMRAQYIRALSSYSCNITPFANG